MTTKQKIGKLGKIAFVFSGGSMRIAFQAGALGEVTRAGITPTYVSGVSSGALIAAAVAANKIPEFIEAIENLESKYVFKFSKKDLINKLRKFKLPKSLLDNAPLLDLILSIAVENPGQFKEREEKERAIGEAIITSNIDCAIVTTHFQLSESKIFTNRDKIIIENPAIFARAILASTSIPGIFPPIDMEESGETPQYVDGDSLKFNPFRGAIEAGYDTIFYFYTPEFPNPDKYYDDVLEIAVHAVMMAAYQMHDPEELCQEALADHIAESDESSNGWLDKIKNIRGKKSSREVRLIVINSESIMIDFDYTPKAEINKERMQELIELGQKRTQKILKENGLI